MLFDDILAQTNAVQTLTRALDNDRVAHAYLFEGPSGVGKQKAALAMACSLLCPQAQPQDAGPSLFGDAPTSSGSRRGCGSCLVCERVLSGKHPDVRVFAPRDEGNRNLQVETVREEILPFTRFAPFEGPHACLIFPEADVSFPITHAEAANALLKTLEEPRPRITFLLLAERPERLLPTIHSRCQTVRFGPLPNAALQQILAKQGVSESAASAAIGLAFGRADRALLLAEDERAQKLLELAVRVDETIEAKRPGAILDAADALAGHDERTLLLDTLCLYYRDVVQAALLGEQAQLAFPERADSTRARAATLGATRAAERQQAIEAATEAIERNANPETTLDAMLLSFQAGETVVIARPNPTR